MGRFLRRLALAVLVAVVAASLPYGLVLGPAGEPLRLAVGVVLFVCLAGKLLYDTLFWERTPW
jgi:hypothetical protein